MQSCRMHCGVLLLVFGKYFGLYLAVPVAQLHASACEVEVYVIATQPVHAEYERQLHVYDCECQLAHNTRAQLDMNFAHDIAHKFLAIR